MASLAQLQADVAAWLNRSDWIALGLLPGWLALVDTEIAETLRARCMVTSAYQNIDTAYIPLPADFCTMESIRDAQTGEMLGLKDEWSGHWNDYLEPSPWSAYGALTPGPWPSREYRLVHDCIEFLPHPIIPNPPDPTWVPQQILMGWYARPMPLVLPTDTNTVLEALYGVYLYGVGRIAALWALDQDRAAQMDAEWQKVITRANLWKQQSDMSGAPLREEAACRF